MTGKSRLDSFEYTLVFTFDFETTKTFTQLQDKILKKKISPPKSKATWNKQLYIDLWNNFYLFHVTSKH